MAELVCCRSVTAGLSGIIHLSFYVLATLCLVTCLTEASGSNPPFSKQVPDYLACMNTDAGVYCRPYIVFDNCLIGSFK